MDHHHTSQEWKSCEEIRVELIFVFKSMSVAIAADHTLFQVGMGD